MEECYFLCEEDQIKYTKRKKLLKQLEELATYVKNNRHIIPNYGEKWRHGESISSSFVESAVNEVVTKRMVKKQQMQWSHLGAITYYRSAQQLSIKISQIISNAGIPD